MTVYHEEFRPHEFRPQELWRLAAVVGAALLVVVSVAWFSVGPITSAGADPIGECSTTGGVIVAVDFSSWGGNVDRGCDATLTTGYDALHAAGFTTAGDSSDGPAFICRIDNEPSPSEDSCIDTPPATAYWSYWHADAGQNTWSLSELGAISYHPPPGSVDAWTFGDTHAPPFAPSAVRATNVGPPLPSSTTTTTRAVTTTVAPVAPVTTSPPPGTTPAAAPTTSVAAGGPGTTMVLPPTTVPSPPNRPATTPAASPNHGSQPTTTAVTAVTTTSPGDEHPAAPVAGPPRHVHPTPNIVDVTPVAAGHNQTKMSAGSATPAIIGALVVVVIAGGAGATAWRRRRRPA